MIPGVIVYCWSSATRYVAVWSDGHFRASLMPEEFRATIGPDRYEGHDRGDEDRT